MTGRKEVESFIHALRVYANLVRFDLTEDICMFYVNALEPHGLTRAREAIVRLARGSKVGKGLPSVNEILELVAPNEVTETTPDEDAAVIAGRIEEALVRYGSQEANRGYPRARKYIGELGWSIVGHRWQHICDSTTNNNLGMLKSQWRNELRAAAIRARASLPAVPELPADPRAQTVEELPPGPVGKAIAKAADRLTIDRKRAAAGERDDDW